MRNLETQFSALVAEVKEKNEALVSLQGALDDNEANSAELQARISILLKLQDEQAKVNSHLQQRLQHPSPSPAPINQPPPPNRS